MRTKLISRRRFINDTAIAVGATVLVACAPAKPQSQTSAAPQPAGEVPPLVTAGRTLKVFIAYDTVYGNTRKIAEAMIEGIGRGHDTSVEKVTASAPGDLEGVDLFILGSPTHGGTFTEPVKNLLASIPQHGLQNMQAASFDTGFSRETQGFFLKLIIDIFGYAAPKIAADLEARGASVLASETFFVTATEGPLMDGELQRARQWANELIQKVI